MKSAVAAALIAAGLAGLPAPAQAFSSLCINPRICLIKYPKCCGIPCPVLDVVRLARFVLQHVEMTETLDLEQKQARSWSAIEQALGPPGARASARSAVADPPIESHGDEGEAERAMGAEDEEDAAHEALVQGAAADADEGHRNLSARVALAEERLAQTEKAVSKARDFRDYVRLAHEYRAAKHELDGLSRAAEALWVASYGAGSLLIEERQVE